MMLLRRRMWGVLPAVVAATFLLVPGVSAARHPKYVKHRVAKHHLRRVPTHRLSHRVPKRKLTHKVTVHRARPKYRPVHHYVYRRRPRRFYHRRVWARYGPSSNRIEQIQQALARSGYYQGDPTGRWDSVTISAMKSFQSAHGITPTGRIDATSLQKLGLGSDIAGVAPPRPILPSQPSSSNKDSGRKAVGEGR